MAPHSSTLAWKIPWMEGPGGLQSMGSRRVGGDWATSLSLFTKSSEDRNQWWDLSFIQTSETTNQPDLECKEKLPCHKAQ